MQHRPLFPAFAGASLLLEPVGPEAGLAVNSTITAVAGLQAGHFTDAVNGTGCSVFLCREGAVGGVDVRGGSPGWDLMTTETAKAECNTAPCSPRSPGLPFFWNPLAPRQGWP